MSGRLLYVAHPIGFCGGVRHAVEQFISVSDEHPGETVYVLHELVHNRTVSAELERRGAKYVSGLESVPDGSLVFLGAHGVRPEVEEYCARRHFRVTNAVCPLVSRLHRAAAEIPEDLPLIMFGDRLHPEVQGILGHARSREVHVIADLDEAMRLPEMESACMLSQTTRNAERIREVAEALGGRIARLDTTHAHVCDAVFQRQRAVRELAEKCEMVLIIGSPHSSNASRLYEIAKAGTRAMMLEGAGELNEGMVENIGSLGIGAGTSTPDSVIGEVLDRAEQLGFCRAEENHGERR